MKCKKVRLHCKGVPEFHIYTMTEIEFKYDNSGKKIWKDIDIEVLSEFPENAKSNVMKLISEQDKRKWSLEIKVLTIFGEKIVSGYEFVNPSISKVNFPNYTKPDGYPIERAKCVTLTIKIDDIKIIEAE
jgi:hypothetical protein